jgi:hypothetical protein
MLQPNGGRTFATFDLLGREAYRYDSRGRLILNQYSPGGKRVATFDEDGRMTLYGGDGARQTTAFTSSGGKVMATEHGSVLRTNDGAMINTTAPYYSGTSQNSQQRAEAFDTNPLRINPRPQTPPR